MKIYKKLAFEYKSIEALKDNPHNARYHPPRQIQYLAKSIKSNGFIRAVLIDETNTIIAGHACVAAAKLLGITEIPTILQTGLTPVQVSAYIIADNRLAEMSRWDSPALAIEIQEILSVEPDFDFSAIGFEIPEIDLLLSPEIRSQDADDIFDVGQDVNPVTEVGDLWCLGPHRLFCGNALDKASYSKLFDKKKAGVVFVDPPYNVPIEGHVSGNGSIHHREFPMAKGDLSPLQFTLFLVSGLQLCADYSRSGSVHFICSDWRHSGELLAAGEKVYDSLLNVCVWVKNVGGTGSFYRSQHEFIYVFRNGEAKHLNNVQLGKFGRNRTNVWQYPSINTLSKTGEEGNLLALHPTVKPVAMVADALLDCSARGDLVLDAFLGSGTTLLAAERTGRVCRGIELDPLYVDIAIGRWQRHTGDSAIHAATGKKFDEIANQCSEVNA